MFYQGDYSTAGVEEPSEALGSQGSIPAPLQGHWLSRVPHSGKILPFQQAQRNQGDGNFNLPGEDAKTFSFPCRNMAGK